MALPDVRIMDDTLTTYLDWRVANLVGSNLLELASCDWLRQGEDLAGTITLSIKAGTLSGANATIVTTPDHTTHPRGYPTPDEFAVLLDGSTAYTNIVPDSSLVFSDYSVVGTAATWTAEVIEGDYLGNYPDDNPDGVPPGTSVYTRRLGVKNTAADTKTNVYVVIERPPVNLWRKAGTGLLASIRAATDEPIEKEDPGDGQTQPYKFSAANLNGGTNRIDVLMDGASITTVRYLDVSPTTTSDSLQLVRGGRYRIESGDLTGLEFKVHASAANSDTCNVTVWDRRCIEIAPDSGGIAGTYQSTDLLVAASLAPAAGAYFHIRVNANVGSGMKNPIQIGLGLRYLTTGVALIEEA